MELQSIVYAFWHERLYTITLWTAGRSNYLALKDLVFSLFGPGTPSDRDRECYIWRDSETDRLLEYHPQDDTGTFWMRSRAIDRQYKLATINRPSSYLKWFGSRASAR